ncbi:RNA polymerase factor sigma-54 [Ramlibacter sp. RBP-2]|uniref:RNA polymerase sigma-54 factor n=1 Tax=Ramlibacter lithotrophicus TaxID=2606681 RepID=A0A7X6DH09_9BURK|nr:RNA polymerase factor sigma-54 [Ramlibacter lithotrophicus]NKE66994.1 RNA polymerase factor sigma-54 [Ramlibacter lithotrophicus]
MKQGLSLRVSQHLALTPQLQQSIRLLQLSTLELAQEVEQMLDENPFLELNQEEPPREEAGPPAVETAPRDADRDAGPDDGGAADDGGSAERETISPAESDAPDWDGDGATDMVADDGEWGGDATPRTGNAAGDEDMDATELASGDETLQSHLLRQAASLRLSHEDRCALEFLIGSLNEDGYLDDPLEALAEELAGPDLEQREELVHRFTVAMRLLQSLEPAGVGARTLAECLTLQLQAMRAAGAGGTACSTALRICAQPMELLARRDVKRLVQLCGAAEADIKAAMALIVRLEPKPGRRFGNTDRNIVVPDVLVTQVGRGGQPRFRVQLNPDVLPRLRVQEVYATALRSHRGEGHQALQQRLQEARWFIKNIQQRFDTILRVATAIVERQKNFFVHGELAMRPLVLREIADELGLHESTISRVTTAKYMATPYGTFELKYFFGSALGTETGGNASSTAVRALIRQFVAAENLRKPLSDSQISDMLKEQGIECARRTVAKYREALRIAPASLRRAL